MPQCAACGSDSLRAEAVYTCNYCGRTHCSDHRLPESHDCPGLETATTLGPDLRVPEAADSFVSPRQREPPRWAGWLLALAAVLGVALIVANAGGLL